MVELSMVSVGFRWAFYGFPIVFLWVSIEIYGFSIGFLWVLSAFYGPWVLPVFQSRSCLKKQRKHESDFYFGTFKKETLAMILYFIVRNLCGVEATPALQTVLKRDNHLELTQQPGYDGYGSQKWPKPKAPRFG